MVPVLSRSSVLTSPDASAALPLIASTLCCMTRSMPAIPMADKNHVMTQSTQAHRQAALARRPPATGTAQNHERLQRQGRFKRLPLVAAHEHIDARFDLYIRGEGLK